MRTVIRNQSEEIIEYLTQQYETGTYCIIDNNPALQFVVKTSENAFHTAIRTKSLRSNCVLVEGSIIKCKNHKLNLFEKDWLEEKKKIEEKDTLVKETNKKIKEKIKNKNK